MVDHFQHEVEHLECITPNGRTLLVEWSRESQIGTGQAGGGFAGLSEKWTFWNPQGTYQVGLSLLGSIVRYDVADGNEKVYLCKILDTPPKPLVRCSKA